MALALLLLNMILFAVVVRGR